MNGNELVTAVREWLRRYYVMTAQQEITMALWTLHTWVYQRLSRTTPYVEITGVSGSGKTTLMEALSLLSRGSMILNTLRTLAMCRRIAETEGAVTYFVDEAERLSSGTFGDQRSMLASGYRRGGQHMVSVGNATATFEVWCPKVFTSLRTTVHVIHNRCIPIWAERGTPVASLSLEWERAEATAAQLIEAYKVVLKNTPRIVTVEPTWLASERDREIWTPLVSLAHTLRLDADAMNLLTSATVDLSALRGIERRMDAVVEDENAKERSYAVMLLRDVKAIVQDGETFIPSTALVDRLRAVPTAPWRNYQRNGLTEITLAQLLGSFAIEPARGQLGKGRKDRTQVRGYKVQDIRKAKA